MNSAFLRMLAVFMVIAALVTAYLGYKTSHQKPTDTLKVVVPTFAQVVARTDIPAGHVLTVEDLETITTQQNDKRAFSNANSLIGKVTTLAVAKGSAFKLSDFPTYSLLGRALAPHERAVAIKANEVIGVGGFIKPGDHVDVLLYLRADRETGEVSSAQVVLTNVKVLAYGALTPETETKQEDEPVQSTPKRLGSDMSRGDTNREKDSRSAILAVAEQDVSKLMLAESTGTIRLALRGATLPEAHLQHAENSQLISLGDLSKASGIQHSNQPITADASTITPTKKKVATSAAKRTRVIVHRGEQVEVVNVAR